MGVLSRIKRIIRIKHSGGILTEGVKPISRLFGTDRGKPIDRYYIEKFIEEQSALIYGNVMEIGGRDYSQKYGEGKIDKSYVLHVTEAKDALSIKGNLETGEGIPENLIDCFILTQTLPFMFDINSAAKNILRVLKPGGYALITVPGISQISRYDMDRWGHYWSFTDLSLKRLFNQFISDDCIQINICGNVKTSACFLYGLALEELSAEELSYSDKDYQMLITAVIKKPK